MAIALATHNPEDALAFALEEDFANFCEGIMGQIYINSYLVNPEKFGSLLEGEETSTGMSQLGTHVGAAKVLLSKEDPDQVLRWASSLPAIRRASVQDGALGAWLRSEPHAAAQYIENSSNMFGTKQKQKFASEWTRRDSTSSSAWVDGLVDTEEKGLLVVSVLQEWSKQDPNDAYAWLGSLPQGKARDAGIHYLIKTEFRNEPENVFAWASLLSSHELTHTAENDMLLRLENMMIPSSISAE